MKMIRKSAVDAHEARKEHLKEQHERVIASLTPPQPMELIKNTDKTPRDLGNGVISMPGDYFTKGGENFSAKEVKDEFVEAVD